MKCPHRMIKRIKYIPKDHVTLVTSGSTTLEINNFTSTIEYEDFEECLGDDCMAYRKVRRTEMCQKFPCTYYKDILG